MDVDMPEPPHVDTQRDALEPARRSVNGKKVAYYYDGDTGNYNYGLGHPMKPHRMRMTHSLLTSYELLDHMDVFRPSRATHDQLTRFHTDEYVDFLSQVTPETVEELTGSGSRFLTGEDCPAFEGLFEFCSISAGGSICAAERLNSGAADTCINWAGGLHHAKKREASGFCYINDIVLAILEFLRYHPRVLYIDIDVHHGDGVEEAFYSTDRVMTASFHKFGDFFPGTGDVRDVGIGKGKNYAVNVPLRDGITDETYKGIFEPVIQHIMDWFQPGAVVLQCGADSLAGDKLGVFNLSMKGHSDCVRFMSKFDVPTLVVGGGGYTTKNVARTWTYETGVVLGKELDENLPYNDYLEYYGPRFKLEVPANNMENQNSREYLEDIKTRIIEKLRSMPFAPSTGMQHVPGSSVGKAIGVLNDGDDSGNESEIDTQINQRLQQIHSAASRQRDDDSDSMIDTDDDSPIPRGRLSTRPSYNRVHSSAHGHSHSTPNASAGPSRFQTYFPPSNISSAINDTILGRKGKERAGGRSYSNGGDGDAGLGGRVGGTKKKRSFFSNLPGSVLNAAGEVPGLGSLGSGGGRANGISIGNGGGSWE